MSLALLFGVAGFAVAAQIAPPLGGDAPAPAARFAAPAPADGPVLLCLVDSGVRSTHVDIAPWWGGGVDLVDEDAEPEDANGHGTHVTGTAAQALAASGATPAHVRILHARAMDADGRGTWDRVAAAVDWCVDAGADVVGLSLAAGSGNDRMDASLERAAGAGVVVVASAGNEAGAVAYPARAAGVVAVACADVKGRSCDGAQGPDVDLSAPGVRVRAASASGDGAYEYRTGTSVSAAHAAAVLAAMASFDASLDAEGLVAAATARAVDVGAPGWDPVTGAGVLE